MHPHLLVVGGRGPGRTPLHERFIERIIIELTYEFPIRWCVLLLTPYRVSVVVKEHLGTHASVPSSRRHQPPLDLLLVFEEISHRLL